MIEIIILGIIWLIITEAFFGWVKSDIDDIFMFVMGKIASVFIGIMGTFCCLGIFMGIVHLIETCTLKHLLLGTGATILIVLFVLGNWIWWKKSQGGKI